MLLEPARRFWWVTRLLAPVAVVGVVIAIAIDVRTREHLPPEVIALASPAVSYRLEAEKSAAMLPPRVASQPQSEPQPQSASQVPAAPPAEVRTFNETERLAGHHKKAAESSSLEEREKRVPSGAASLPSVGATSMGAPVAGKVQELPKAEEPARELAPEPSIASSLESRGEAPSNVQAPRAPARMLSGNAAASSAPSRPTILTLKTTQSNQVSSPDGRVAWQFGEDGTILRSATPGVWLPQRSGVTTDLLAGSAPSNEVCWIAGRSGTIVRSLDSGAHWQLVKPPSHDNFTAIAASDSNNATVSTGNGQRFGTHDGGVTWSSQ